MREFSMKRIGLALGLCLAIATHISNAQTEEAAPVSEKEITEVIAQMEAPYKEMVVKACKENFKADECKAECKKMDLSAMNPELPKGTNPSDEDCAKVCADTNKDDVCTYYAQNDAALGWGAVVKKAEEWREKHKNQDAEYLAYLKGTLDTLKGNQPKIEDQGKPVDLKKDLEVSLKERVKPGQVAGASLDPLPGAK